MKVKSLLFSLLPLLTGGCAALQGAARRVIGCGGKISGPGPELDPQMLIITKCWWLIPGCLLGLGAAAFLLVMKQIKLAIGLAAGFGVTLILSITVFKHFALIGYIVLAIGLLVAGYTLWRVWVNRKALVEVVATTEKIKPYMAEVTKQIMFGGREGPNDSGEAGIIQSPSTEKLVKQERVKLAKANKQRRAQ